MHVKAEMNKRKETIREIEKIDDPESQGYATSPLLCDITGLTPEELLLHTVKPLEDSAINLKRTIGVIRWCLDQRNGPAT